MSSSILFLDVERWPEKARLRVLPLTVVRSDMLAVVLEKERL